MTTTQKNSESYNDNKKEREQIIEKYKWYDDNLGKLNELYEKNDFAGMNEKYMSDADSTVLEAVRTWEHYKILRLYSYNYSYIERYINNGYYMNDKWTYVILYRDCIDFIVTAKEEKEVMQENKELYAKDIGIADGWIDYVREFVISELKVTAEEFENDMKDYTYEMDDEIKKKAGEYFQRLQ